MAAKKVVKRVSKPIEKTETEDAADPTIVSEIPHIDDLFKMEFRTSVPGEIVGVRRGLRLGVIEIYRIKK